MKITTTDYTKDDDLEARFLAVTTSKEIPCEKLSTAKKIAKVACEAYFKRYTTKKDWIHAPRFGVIDRVTKNYVIQYDIKEPIK